MNDEKPSFIYSSFRHYFEFQMKHHASKVGTAIKTRKTTHAPRIDFEHFST